MGASQGESVEEAWVCTGSRKVQTGDRIACDGAAGNHHPADRVFFQLAKCEVNALVTSLVAEGIIQRAGGHLASADCDALFREHVLRTDLVGYLFNLHGGKA